MRISDWSSDVCSSDLPARQPGDDEEDQDDETDEEQPAEITVVGALAFGLVGGGGARRGFLGGQLNLLGNRAHAVLNAAGHIAGLESGRHDIAYDPARQRVGQDRLEALADRDAPPPLVRPATATDAHL